MKAKLKYLALACVGAILVLGAVAPRTPLLRAFLQSNLDGNGFAITNAKMDLLSITNANNLTNWALLSTNYVPLEASHSTNADNATFSTNAPSGYGVADTNWVLQQMLGSKAAVIIATTNSPAAIQSAANYLCTGTNDNLKFGNALSNNVGLIMVAPGDYYVSNLYVMARSGIMLLGTPASKIHAAPLQPGSPQTFSFANCTNLTIRDLVMVGDSAQQTNGTSNPLALIILTLCEDVAIKNCNLSDAEKAVDIGGCNRVTIQNCTIHGQTLNAGHLLNADASGTNYNQELKIIGNHFYNISSASCKIEQTVGVQFVGNTVISYSTNTSYNFVFGPNDDPPDTINNAYQIFGNSFVGNVQLDTTDTNMTVNFSKNLIRGGNLVIQANGSSRAQARSTIIDGNEIYDSTGIGLTIATDFAFGDYRISGNRIENCNEGVRLLTTNISSLVISDNHIANCVSTTSTGIEVRSGFSQIINNRITWTNALASTVAIYLQNPNAGTNVVRGNVIMNAAKGIYLSGTNNTVESNLMLGTGVFLQESSSDQNKLFNNSHPNVTTVYSRPVTDGKLDWDFNGGGGVFILGGDGSLGAQSSYSRSEGVEKILTIAAVPKSVTNKPLAGLTLDVGAGGGNIMYLGGINSANYGNPQRIIATVGSSTTSTGTGTTIFSARNSGLAVGSDSTPSASLDVYGSAIVRTNLTVGGTITATNAITATNFILITPQWVDMIGTVLPGAGVAEPVATAITNNSLIKAPGYQLADEEHYAIQMPHNIAVTNSNFVLGTNTTQWHVEPHVHFMTSGTIDATHSNVTWQIEWAVSEINGDIKASGTNTVTKGVTVNGRHYLAEFGPITNAGPWGISSVFNARLSRQSSGSQELAPNGSTRDVVRLNFDLHLPVGNVTSLGSREETAQ